MALIKFIYSKKATKFCEIFPLLFTTVHTVKNKEKISQNFVAFSVYINSKKICYLINFKGHLSKYNFLRSEMNTIVSLKIKAKKFALLPRKKG